jgi:hypothetical protein
MKKYCIEGNINFYEELYKSLDQEDEDDDNICLTTNEKLTDKFVKLKCGHKFNYIPLYNDLINYKFKYNNMESHNNKLKYNEIRCPYCRNKQDELLPYYNDDINIQKYHGINYIDEKFIANNSHKMYNPLNKCCYKEKNILFDETKPESETNEKYIECYNYGYPYATCSMIYAGNTTNNFCSYHQKVIIKQHNDKVKEKLKEEKQKLKDEKQKLKDEKQKLKDEQKIEKMKQKELLKAQKEVEKQNKKMENTKNKLTINNENIILGPSNITLETNIEEQNLGENKCCIEILKSGKNKGSNCNVKTHKDELCKRHYNIKNKFVENIKI